MKRVILGTVIGAIVLMAWNAASWMLIPWHVMQKLPGEERVVEALRDTGTESGVYHVPGIDQEAYAAAPAEQRAAMMEAFTEAHEAGPIAFLSYRADGAAPMAPMVFVKGFVLYLLMALVASAVLVMAGPALPGFGSRLGIVVLIGVYTALATHLANWNWVYFPLRYSLEVAADAVVGALLLGIVLALIVKPSSRVVEEDFEVMAG